MRSSIAYSSSDSYKRDDIQKSHQEAIILSESAHNALKRLERTQRRIERLIDMLEANDQKKDKGPDYRKELEKLELMKLFGRSKYSKPKLLPRRDFHVLIRAFKDVKAGDIADIAEAEKQNFELVNYKGEVVDGVKLEQNAKALEDKVRRDVGMDNIRAHPIPISSDDAKKILKWIDKISKLIDILLPV